MRQLGKTVMTSELSRIFQRCKVIGVAVGGGVVVLFKKINNYYCKYDDCDVFLFFLTVLRVSRRVCCVFFYITNALKHGRSIL